MVETAPARPAAAGGGGTPPALSRATPGVAASRRGTGRFFSDLLRGRVGVLPPECFAEPLVYAPVAGRPRLYVTDPALIHEAFVRRAAHLDKGPLIRRVLGHALGEGILTADGERWRAQRAAAAPAFAQASLMGFLPAMLRAAERTRDRWRAAGPDAALDLGHEMTETTFAIVVDTMLSGSGALDVDRVERAIGRYLGAAGWLAAAGLLHLPARMPFPGRRRALDAAAVLRGGVEAMVARRRAEPPRPDLVSRLLEAADPETGARMGDGAVADNLLTFIAAGHETTAQALTWTLRLLADHPEVEAALVAEVEAVTGGAPLRPEHVPHLHAARRAVSEAMRLYPPVPTVERHVARDLPLAGFAVPAGAVLAVPVYALHRRAALWPDPERFDPGRFAPERAEGRHRHSYLPFGAGARSCIGSGFALLEAAAILGVILRALRPVPLDPAFPEPRMRITLRPARPVLVRAAPR